MKSVKAKKGPKFKKLRKVVSKTDAISIMLTSTGDVYDNYLSIKQTPRVFDECRVIGFGQSNSIAVDGYDILMTGTEFYLDDSDITLPNKESEEMKNGK